MTARRLRQAAGDRMSGWVLFGYLGLSKRALGKGQSKKTDQIVACFVLYLRVFEVIFLTKV